MDEFVRSFLNKWKLTEWIDTFQEQEVDKESLLCLGENDIEKLIPKAGPRARFRKGLRQEIEKKQVCEEEEAHPRQGGAHGGGRGQEKSGCPAAALSDQQVQTSGASWIPPEDLPSSSIQHENEEIVIKRKGPQAETDRPVKMKRQSDAAPGLFKGDLILNDVKDLMKGVSDTLRRHEKTKLNIFLRKKIEDLDTKKRNLVGLFGKSGAGKSSLINAIVEEKGLLPTGSLQACTTVMIQVEANTDSKYEAEIEFISKEEWKDELWSLKNLFGEISDEENKDDEDYKENIEKMTALYGDEWKHRSPENLMEPKYFKEIPEFLHSGRKTMKVESAKELASKVEKYTRSDSNDGKRWFWPLVKCVTVKVPNSEILKHVTLVDLPGNGDRNKTRDQMWKKIISSCSTVWVVSEMNRSVTEKDAWEILENTCSLMGNGGECQNIYFICTKCDADETTDNILTRNVRAKDLVMKEFKKLNKVKKQFHDDCFQVFTVSSKQFFKQKKLDCVQTEIPKLQELLRCLNNQQDQTLNYVCGAYGILSLIKGAKLGNLDPHQTAQVCDKLTEIREHELQKVKKSMDEVFEVFEKCLSEGVKESLKEAEVSLKKKLKPVSYNSLKCALQNNGVHKTQKKKLINLNETISSSLTESIDEEFRKTFPNDAKSGPIYGVIHEFSLDKNQLVQQYKAFELQLTFINTEVTKVKRKLCKDIRDRKKEIYCSLTETVKETMQECYNEAAQYSGSGSLERMKCKVQNHLKDVKDMMFHKAKDNVLAQLKGLMGDVQKQLRDTLQESIELSFKTDHQSVPDFEREYNLVKKHLDDCQNKDDLAWPDL